MGSNPISHPKSRLRSFCESNAKQKPDSHPEWPNGDTRDILNGMELRTVQTTLHTSQKLAIVLVIVAPAMAFLAFGLAKAQDRATVTRIAFTAPLTTTFFNDCAAENVTVNGTFRVLLQTTETPSGNRHVVTESNFSSVSGIGETSGLRYQVPSTGGAVFNGDIDMVNVTSANHTFRLVGQGPDNNLNVHGVLHITWNGNGELVVEFEKVSIECR